MTGARLYIARPEGHKDNRYLATIIQEQLISIIHFVPSMLQYFLDEMQEGDFSCLRHVICSGEALSAELQEHFQQKFAATLYNLYGPTEAAIDVTFWQCQPEVPRRFVAIGRPIANIQTYVLNRSLQPVPPRAIGELYIGGVGLARGYHNRADLTAERFIPHPFSLQPGARLYKTGDAVYQREDGVIEFVGRLDNQVKLRGLRIEPGEIEARALQYPGIVDCLVTVLRVTATDQRLVLYMLTKQDIAISALRRFLQEQLPDYMIPASFMPLKQWPLSPNGKVNRLELPLPDETRPELDENYVAARSPSEEAIADIWQQLLEIDMVGVEDNFFDLGGHSLLAMQVVSQVAEVFQVDITLRDFLQDATVAALAECVEARMMEDVKQMGEDEIQTLLNGK
jgi:acyl-coenzyme A synthetase/AMP-(fatty) acid ligase/acyl carrier protein